jgi:hypothetical protein
MRTPRPTVPLHRYVEALIEAHPEGLETPDVVARCPDRSPRVVGQVLRRLRAEGRVRQERPISRRAPHRWLPRREASRPAPAWVHPIRARALGRRLP